jgi:hypothetical protein
VLPRVAIGTCTIRVEQPGQTFFSSVANAWPVRPVKVSSGMS